MSRTSNKARNKSQKERRLPDSEFRRVYMKDLMSRLKHSGLNEQQAKDALQAFIPFLRDEMHAGRTLDFGFMKLSLKTVPPRTYHFNLAKEGGSHPVFMGEMYKWNVNVYDSWKAKTRPAWARV